MEVEDLAYILGNRSDFMEKICRNYSSRVKNLFKKCVCTKGGGMAMITRRLEFGLSGIGLIFANKYYG